MQEIDKNLSCSVKGGREYADFSKLPTGEAFEAPFSMWHKILRRDERITLYVGITSSMQFNNIKYKHMVYAYIQTKGTFMKPDRFKTKKTGSLVCIIELHPTLVWKDTFKADLQAQLEYTDITEHKHTLQYLQEHFQNWKPREDLTL
eukprot:13014015-Ditylum_brightwellii.AAC.1